MKIIKTLIVVSVLFLTAGINVASAQDEARNDSIYGLEVSIKNEEEEVNISFYSTYNIEDLEVLWLNYYDEKTDKLLLGDYTYCINGFFMVTMGNVRKENISEGVYKINRSSYLHPILQSKSLKIEVYLEGYGYTPPSLRTGTIGRSNVLTFYYDPEATSLITPEATENYTYKYISLSGIESKEKPVGVPFIQMIYKDGILIHSNKCLIQK
jgi:hypothetical protein